MNTASKVLLLLFIFKLSRAEECDVRMWFLEMTTKGAFDGELSVEQLFIQKTINEMILSSKKDTSKRKVNCDVLEMYEEMLKPDEEEDSSDKQDDNERDNELKSNKEEQSTEDTSLLIDKVNDDETKTVSDDSEESAEHSVGEGAELHSSKETDETHTTEDDEMEVDETELLSTDDEEEEEEIEKFDTIEEEIFSDFSTNNLDKLVDEETIVLSIDQLEETVSIDDDRSVGMSQESLLNGDNDNEKIKDENKNIDNENSMEPKKEPTGKEEQSEIEDKDKISPEKLKQETKDSSTNKNNIQKNGLRDSSDVSEEGKESKDKESDANDGKETDGYKKNDGSDLERKELKEMETEDKGDYNSIKSNASALNKSATVRDGSKETKHTIEKPVILFGMSRRYYSYWFDIFDLLQNSGGFIENNTLLNKTEPQRNAKLNQDIDASNVTSPVIYNRLVCSPCSLLMRFSEINTSCSVDIEENVYTQLKSNETQANQTNANNSTVSNVETQSGTDASHPLKAEENSEKMTANKEIPESKAHTANVDVLKVSDVDQSGSKETDEQDTDIEETAGSGSDHKVTTDTVSQRKLTESSLEKDLADDKGHATSNVKSSSNEMSPPEANSDPKSEEKGTIIVEEKQHSTETDKTLILEQLQSNFDDFQEQVVSKTDSYSNKLQNLEMMVIRLENQLLKEKLNKNNHSSTITKMENHILKLENELLKLNQSYSDIRQKSDSMVKDQKKYLELSHSSQKTPAYGYSAVSGRTNSISIEFHAKITYLTQLLSNQSMTIRQLKTRSEYLEDQNRLLYNMIMNQTALMTQIMTRVQDLTEQNIQQRIEAQKIRQEMDKMTSKRGVAATTDRFLLDKLEEMVSDVQKKTLEEDDDVQLKQIKTHSVNKDKSEQELEKYMQSESVSKTESWCGALSGTCVLSTVVRTTCIPFSSFQWKVCFNKKETKKTSLKLSDTSTLKEDEEPIVEKEKHIASHQTGAFDQGETSSDAKRKEDSLVITQTPNKNQEASSHTNVDTMVININDNKVHEQQEGYSKNSAEKEHENKGLGKQGNSDVKQELSYDIKEDKKGETPTESHGTSPQNTLPKQGGSIDKASSDESKQVETSPTESDVKVAGHASDGVDGKAKTLASEEDAKVLESASDSGDEKVKTSVSGVDAKVSTADGSDNGKASDKASDTDVDTADKSRDENSPVDVNNRAANKEDTPPTDEIKEKVNTKPQKEEKLTLKEDTKQHMTDPQKEKETTSQSPEQKERKSTSTESVGETKGRDDTSANDVQDANNKTKPAKETSEKVESKKQDRKEKGTKEDVKEETGNIKREQSKKAKPKSKKSNEAVNVKSQEKKSEEPLKKPIKYLANGQKEPKDCYDYYKRGNQKSGVFKIKPYGKSSMVEVFCDMKNGGWTVIQKRQDGTTKFLKKWLDFKEGFGGIRGEHWLGNDHIHYLTNQGHYSLKIELTDWNKTKKVAEYDYFMIDDEAEGYRLHIGGYHGDAGDGMAKHNNHKFSTTDVDNDKVTKEFGGSCAKRFSGAWWYYKCYMSNLNGIYYRNGVIPPKLFDGIAWKPWTGSNYSLRSAEMKIRPSNLT